MLVQTHGLDNKHRGKARMDLTGIMDVQQWRKTATCLLTDLTTLEVIKMVRTRDKLECFVETPWSLSCSGNALQGILILLFNPTAEQCMRVMACLRVRNQVLP